MDAYAAAKAQDLTGAWRSAVYDDPTSRRSACRERLAAAGLVGFTLGDPAAGQLGVSVEDLLVDRAFGPTPRTRR